MSWYNDAYLRHSASTNKVIFGFNHSALPHSIMEQFRMILLNEAERSLGLSVWWLTWWSIQGELSRINQRRFISRWHVCQIILALILQYISISPCAIGNKSMYKLRNMDQVHCGFCEIDPSSILGIMMTSSDGNIFRVTGHLCGEFTGPRWIPHTFDMRPNKRLSKQCWGCWFETSSSPLWRYCNDIHVI